MTTAMHIKYFAEFCGIFIIPSGIIALIIWVVVVKFETRIKNTALRCASAFAKATMWSAKAIGWVMAGLIVLVLIVVFWHFAVLCLCFGLLGWAISSIITDAVAAGVR